MKALAPVMICLVAVISAWAVNPQGDVASAIDAKGIRYVVRSEHGMPPWFAAAIFKRKPDYPYEERVLHHEGSGLFRILIDLKTGLVTNVITVKSTGYPKLDQAAI